MSNVNIPVNLPGPTVILTTEPAPSATAQWKESCKVATTVDIVLIGIQVVDGEPLGVGDRVLVKDQILQKDNGVYSVSASVWPRTEDANTSALCTDMVTLISRGAANTGLVFRLATHDITLGTTPLSFVSVTGGAGITSLNTLTAGIQAFAVGVAGVDVNWVSAFSTHTLNIPDASATARGILNTGTQVIAGSKTITVTDAVDNAVTAVLTIGHNTSGTPAPGIGTKIQILSNATGAPSSYCGELEWAYTDVAVPTKEATFTVRVVESGTLQEVIQASSKGLKYRSSLVPKILDASVEQPTDPDYLAVFFDTSGSLKAKTSSGLVYGLGGGIASLNGLVGTNQLFTTATTGTDFNISSAGILHTFSIPSASVTARGMVTTSDQYFAGHKYIYVKDGGVDIQNVLSLLHDTTAPSAPGIGVGIEFRTETDSGEGVWMGGIRSYYTDVVHATRTSVVDFQTVRNGSVGTPLRLGNGGINVDGVQFVNTAPGAIINPDTGAYTMFISNVDFRVKLKSSTGVVRDLASEAAGGITSLNGLSTGTQVFAINNGGSDTYVNSAIDTHTFYIPDATFSTTRGLVTAVTQTFAGAKTFKIANTVNNAATTVLTVSHTGTAPATNIGTSIDIKCSTTTQERTIGQIIGRLTDVTDATSTSNIEFYSLKNASLSKIASIGDSSFVADTFITFVANVAPSAPAAGAVAMYADSTDNTLRVKRSDTTLGVVTLRGTSLTDGALVLWDQTSRLITTTNSLTSSELTQLRNIDATVISTAKWGFLGAMDQSVATTSTPTFAGLALDNGTSAVVLRMGDTMAGARTTTIEMTNDTAKVSTITGTTDGDVATSAYRYVDEKVGAATIARFASNAVTLYQPLTIAGMTWPVTPVSSLTYIPLITDYCITCNTTANSVTITLPTLASATGRQYVFIKTATANSMIINTFAAGQFIDDDAMLSVTFTHKHDKIVLFAGSSTNWYTL
jgi:hypothetical protein